MSKTTNNTTSHIESSATILLHDAFDAMDALQLASTQSTNVALKKCATIVGLLNKQWNSETIANLLAEAMPSVYGEKKSSAGFTTDKNVVSLMDYFTATKQGASHFKNWCKKNGFTYCAISETATRNATEQKSESATEQKSESATEQKAESATEQKAE